MTRFDVARTQQPKSTAAYGSLRFGPLRYQLKRTIGMLPTPDNSECSRQPQACDALKGKENRRGSYAYMNRRTHRRQPIKSRVFRDSEYSRIQHCGFLV
ncbi:hypothetical protein [Tateyamaria sp.]|uniref:hypothetical protein n=1 Tax=Tateyamaria sp. TaxID=1929288 RepID=UPI003B20E5C9